QKISSFPLRLPQIHPHHHLPSPHLHPHQIQGPHHPQSYPAVLSSSPSLSKTPPDPTSHHLQNSETVQKRSKKNLNILQKGGRNLKVLQQKRHTSRRGRGNFCTLKTRDFIYKTSDVFHHAVKFHVIGWHRHFHSRFFRLFHSLLILIELC